MLTALRIIRRDILKYLRHLRIRKLCQDQGLCFAANSTFYGRLSDFSFGLSCSVKDYTVIDITNDPASPYGNAKITLEDYVYIGEGCNLRAAGTHINIGAHTMIANNVIIIGSNHCIEIGTPMRLQPWNIDTGGVDIGKDCWIGAGSIILPGSKIGDGSIVAAGAVVRGEVLSGSIVGGVPARLIRMRV